MITYYQKTVSARKLRPLPDFKAGSWIHVEDPNDEELDRLVESHALDRGLLSDAIDPFEVPRVENDGSMIYVFTRVPFDAGGTISTTPVLLGISKDFVFTVTRSKLDIFNRMISGSVSLSTTQKIRLFITILSIIDQEYGKFITLINKEVRRTVGSLEREIANSDIIRLVNMENVLNDLLDALVPTNAALQNLLSGKLLTLYEEDKDFVEDVYLANGQLIELSRANLRTIVNVRNAYSTIMTNTLNRVIKLLTGLTIVLTVPTIVINLYGMNVPLPFQDSAHAFWIIMFMTAAATAIAVWYFNHKRWLG